MNEKQIERKLTDYASKSGVLSLKLAGPNDRGKPDRMFLYEGRVLFIEVKGKGNKPTELQKKWLERLTEKGFKAEWIDNLPEGMDLIDDFVEDQP